MFTKQLKNFCFLFFLVSFFLFLIQIPSNADTSGTTNALVLRIDSIDYNFRGLFNGFHSTFDIWSNMTVENTSSENITIGFGSSCLWDTQVICSFLSTDFEYSFSEGICAFVCVPVIFSPGITKMRDHVELRINDYNLTVLPKGRYTIKIGEERSEYYEEIKEPGLNSFTVWNEHDFTFTNLNYTSSYFLIPFWILLILVYKKMRKKVKQKKD